MTIISTLGSAFNALKRKSAPAPAAPAWTRAPSDRNLVVLYLAGGNDALSFLVPYKDDAYYRRRPTQAVPADRVLPIGTDANRTPLGLHPKLTGLKSMFDQGHVSFIQRTGYENASRSHFVAADIISTADRARPKSNGWLGRYLETLPSPVNALAAWNTQFQLPRALLADSVGAPSIMDPAAYASFHPWGEAAAVAALASHRPQTDSNLAFINSVTRDALATIPRIATVAPRKPTTAYPDNPLGSALQLVAAAIGSDLGTKVYWVQAAGYDTHAAQGTLQGTYAKLLTVLNDALLAFYSDLKNQGLLDKTLILQFSEFGRRVDENASQGTDHGAAGLTMAIGGAVRGGIYGTAARLADRGKNPDLENSGRDVRHETDYRAVYARVLDHWMGADSVPILQGDYRSTWVGFV